MPLKLNWTVQADAMLRQLRTEGRSWDAVAGCLGVSRNAALARGRALRDGVAAVAEAEPEPTPASAPAATEDEEERGPLPAGHAVSWGLLTEGTCLEGEPYPYPVFA